MDYYQLTYVDCITLFYVPLLGNSELTNIAVNTSTTSFDYKSKKVFTIIGSRQMFN